MSGGSYNYLYNQESPDPEQLENVAQRLISLGYSALARESRAKVVAVDDPLRQAWKAVEWLDSHDWSPRQAILELEDVKDQISPSGVAMSDSPSYWVCLVDEWISSRLDDLPVEPTCLKNPVYFNLDEQDLVDEHNNEHRDCGWFRLVKADD